MKLKDRIKTYNFWVSLISALFLIINLIGQKFNFHIDELLFNNLLTSLCGILVILGIIAPPTSPKVDKLPSIDIDDQTTTSPEKVETADNENPTEFVEEIIQNNILEKLETNNEVHEDENQLDIEVSVSNSQITTEQTLVSEDAEKESEFIFISNESQVTDFNNNEIYNSEAGMLKTNDNDVEI